MITALLEKLQRRSLLSKIKKHPKITCSSIRIGINNQLIISENIKSIQFGSQINFRNFVHILVEKEASLVLGDNVFMNNFCSINALESITIGNNTLFGENVKLYDHNHEYERNDGLLLLHHQKFVTAPIVIGNNCWLGSNVTVLKGVTIGDNCIIGAGCTIHSDIPANSTIVNQQNLNYK